MKRHSDFTDEELRNLTAGDLWEHLGVEVVTAADVKAEPIDWLWEGRIPFGQLTIVEGDPDQGKSFVTIDLAARLSSGVPMHGCDTPASPSAAIFVSIEDHLAQVVRPRVEAAGADLSRIHFVRMMRADDEGRTSISPTLSPAGLAQLEGVIRWAGARLLVIDPLMAYIPADIDSHKDQDVRGVLTELARIAERTGAAIILLRHLVKGGGSKKHRGSGSIGILGAARVVYVAEGTDGWRELSPVKFNIGPKPASVRYRIVEGAGAGRVEWRSVLVAGNQIEREHTVADHVVTVAMRAPAGFGSANELAAAAKGRGSRKAVLQAIKYAMAGGRLEKRDGRIFATLAA